MKSATPLVGMIGGICFWGFLPLLFLAGLSGVGGILLWPLSARFTQIQKASMTTRRRFVSSRDNLFSAPSYPQRANHTLLRTAASWERQANQNRFGKIHKAAQETLTLPWVRL